MVKKVNTIQTIYTSDVVKIDDYYTKIVLLKRKYLSMTKSITTQEFSNLMKENFDERLEQAIFFSIWVFYHDHSRITGLQGKGEGISLTPHYHFHLLHRHLDISWAITPESSPLHIPSSQTQTGNLWFPSASC